MITRVGCPACYLIRQVGRLGWHALDEEMDNLEHARELAASGEQERATLLIAVELAYQIGEWLFLCKRADPDSPPEAEILRIDAVEDADELAACLLGIVDRHNRLQDVYFPDGPDIFYRANSHTVCLAGHHAGSHIDALILFSRELLEYAGVAVDGSWATFPWNRPKAEIASKIAIVIRATNAVAPASRGLDFDANRVTLDLGKEFFRATGKVPALETGYPWEGDRPDILRVMQLLHEGKDRAKINDLTGVPVNTITVWRRRYLSRCIAAGVLEK